MKKMIMVIAGLLFAASIQAASVDWKVNGAAAEKGYTAYMLLGATAVTEWESAEAVQAAAISSATFGGSRTVYAGATAASDALTKDNANAYFVIISSDGKWASTDVQDLSSFVYDPAALETPSGTGTFAGANLNYSTFGSNPPPGPTPVDTPEPTSGLLLLIGGAALALRRKQK